MYRWVSKREDPIALYIRTKCLSHYLLLCVCVCTWVQVNTKSITTNPTVETCNSDSFTRMHPQIYGCVSICMGVSVFSRKTLCVTQDKLIIVRAATHSECSSEPQFGKKWKESILWSRSGILNMCGPPAGNKWPLSFTEPQPVIEPSVPVQRRPRVEETGNAENTRKWCDFSLHFPHWN